MPRSTTSDLFAFESEEQKVEVTFAELYAQVQNIKQSNEQLRVDTHYLENKVITLEEKCTSL